MNSISFLEPLRLWALVGVAVLVVLYTIVQRRRGRYAVRLASAELLDSVLPRRPGWRRHVAAGIFLLAATVLTAAFARPAAPVRVPRERATVMVAIDVSLSMQAEDVEPNRLVAARLAAKRFVEELPSTLNVGIVAFAGTASVIVPPTTDRELAQRAIDNLELAESTAIGDAILVSLDAIANMPPDASGETPPARIVLLSDGETTVGTDDARATTAAVEAGVPVSTIAFGTKEGFILYDDPGTDAVEQNLIPVPVGDANLEAIADETDGTYFSAASLGELEEVYRDIGSAIGYETVDREITDWFVAGGLVALLTSSLLSLWWFQRLL